MQFVDGFYVFSSLPTFLGFIILKFYQMKNKLFQATSKEKKEKKGILMLMSWWDHIELNRRYKNEFHQSQTIIIILLSVEKHWQLLENSWKHIKFLVIICLHRYLFHRLKYEMFRSIYSIIAVFFSSLFFFLKYTLLSMSLLL